MAKRKKRNAKSTHPRDANVTPERRAKGDIANRPDGGAIAFDWVDRLAERGHIDTQDLSAFRTFEQLQYNITQSGASIDYEKPVVQTSGAGDIFTDVLIDSSNKLAEIYDCVGAKNYNILSRLIGANSSSDFRWLNVSQQAKTGVVVPAIKSLATYYSTKRHLKPNKAA